MDKLKSFILVVTFFLNFTTFINAQERYIGKEFSIGFAPMYNAEVQQGTLLGNHYYQEFIANTHFSARLSRNWFIGIRSHLIHVRQKMSPAFTNTHSINGLFAQYSIISSNRVRVSFELSYSFGDYCACKPNQPLYDENLFYLGYGVTADFQFLKERPNWWINVGLQTYHINGYYESYDSKMPLNPDVLIGQYTVPVVGIQYKFGDKTIFTTK